MSLRSVIDRFAEVITGYRQGPGSITDPGGIYVPDGESTFLFKAHIQPVNGRLMMSLPQGQTAEDTRVLYTQTQLRVREPAGASDQIDYEGSRWRVYQVAPHKQLSGGPHYTCMIVRQVVTV